MPYTLPNFNLAGWAWAAGHIPAVDPPDNTDYMYQLYRDSRSVWDGGDDTVIIRMPLNGPPGLGAFVGSEIFEIEFGTSRYWKVYGWLVMHEGFPNAYLAAFAYACSAYGTGVTPHFP